MTYIKKIALFIFAFTLANCGIYSFTGASISPDTKTFQINRFENNSLLVEPGLEVTFRNTMIQILENQTNLNNVNTNGDIVYEGEITEYRISPTTSTAQNTAAQNRLTISVKVHFFDKNDPEAEFEQRFSFFHDFEGTALPTGSVKDTAIEEIFERITQDVFNESLAKW
ncbi:LptE family protein [Flavobacteriaceae bacterium MHTCC 0001]